MIYGFIHPGPCTSINLNDIINIMPFTKGHTGYNKGKKLKGEWRDCLRCGKNSWFNLARILHGGGKYCSRLCSNKSTGLRGEKSPHWKGDKVGYSGIHDWLQTNFGKANKCENSLCSQTTGNYQWAKIKDKEYERKRENFIQLCTRCHVIYDGTIPYVSKGMPRSKETKLKISESLKRYFAKL